MTLLEYFDSVNNDDSIQKNAKEIEFLNSPEGIVFLKGIRRMLVAIESIYGDDKKEIIPSLFCILTLTGDMCSKSDSSDDHETTLLIGMIEMLKKTEQNLSMSLIYRSLKKNG
jgi:hypothetical protein